MEKLPVLITIPHGGNKIPAELKDKIAIGEKEIFEDIDPFTLRIYDLGDKAHRIIKTDIARTFVDLSRSPDDLPPNNPDGVVKSHTCFGKVIYKEFEQPDDKEIELLLNKYYHPYHNNLHEIVTNYKNDLKICLDCHTMAETGPVIAPDSGLKRPLICLGDRFGESASKEMTYKLANCFISSFKINEKDLTLNKPFAGGFITRNYGNNPLPWIQVEISRALYLKKPYFNKSTLTISDETIEELNGKFFLALKNFFS